MPAMKRSYVAVTVTLATAATQQLLPLINAVIAAEAGTPTDICPGMARYVFLQSFPGIQGAGVNTTDILVGDAKLTTTRIGKVLVAAGGIFEDRSPVNNVDIGSIYVQTSGASQKLNVIVAAG